MRKSGRNAIPPLVAKPEVCYNMAIQTMDNKIKQLRRDILLASFAAGACHLGSALSALPILVDLFYTKKIEPKNFVFSKASGVAAYYAILADLGHFPKDCLALYLHDYPLASKEVPGITHSVGSIGHGLNVAAGMAYADRTTDIYVLCSDGELQEGSTWEALWWASSEMLSNLHVIIDWNGFQACDAVADVMDTDMVRKVLGAFDFLDIQVVENKKGFGVSFMENNNDWHYKNLTPELLAQALKENK